MVNLGKVYTAQKQWAEAEKTLKRAAACAPRMAVIYESLGFVVQKQKRLDEAVDYYNQALAIRPSPGTQKMLEVALQNIAIASENQAMADAERQSEEAFLAEQRRVEEEERKREEYEKKTRDD
jgi:tetratricopeptide (TPR) repeat protein